MKPLSAVRAPYAARQPRHTFVSMPAALRELPWQQIEADHTTTVAASTVVHHDMHPGVYKLAVFSWAIFMAIFWLTFWPSAHGCV
jgi:hypothetical protein